MQPEQNGIKTWQWVVTVIVIIVLVFLGYYVFRGSDAVDEDSAQTTEDQVVSKDTNRVVVTDQFPGNIVYLSSVQLQNPGFVVIKKDNKGVPGDVIGSQYFEKGINPGKVTLKNSTVEGGMYYAVLYTDTNNNKIFDEKTDQPLKDADSKVIMRPFKAASTVPEIKG